jgi:sarcosine oxidase subunit alpha
LDRRIYDHPHRRFRRGLPVTLRFDGHDYRAFAGEPLAVALFASGAKVLSRSQKYHRPRTFFCLSGHCNACLMRADDLPNVRSCMTPCHDGHETAGQNAYPSSDIDVLGIVDWMFKKGMDHHTLMTGSKVLNSVMQKVVRQLSGLGELPGKFTTELPEPESITADVCVVGAGPAGLAAATAAARAGARVVCVDEADEPGGSLLVDPRFGPDEAARRAEAARKAGVDLRKQASTVSYFGEDEQLLAVATPERLLRITARNYVYATGAHDVNALFEDNDRPGVFAARAVGRLAVRWGVRPGDRVVVVGGGPYARALAEDLTALGVETRLVDGSKEKPLRAHGVGWVESLEIVDDKGKKKKLPCDCVAVAALPSPASEAPRQHGAAVELREPGGGFCVLVDDDGRTSVPHVFACGDVTGFVGPEAATASGERAGMAAAK